MSIRAVATIAAAALGWATGCSGGDAGPATDVVDDIDAIALSDTGPAADTARAADTAPSWPQPRASCVRWSPGSPDPTAALFDPGCVIDVAVSMDVGDWWELRHQTRSLTEILGGDCLDGPPEDVFTWFEADVEVGGVTVAGAGIRKKGFLGSLDDDKPSLKIRFDKLHDGQELAGAKRMTLNNMRQDEGLINSCLAYGLMTRMGVTAPRCNFARVWVNGLDLGVFAHVESIKKPFLRRHFASDGGNLYEATLSDFNPLFRGTWEKKTNEEEADWSDVDAVVAALEVPDDGLLYSLDAVIDLDAFVTFWAAEVLVGHWDGYAGNLNNTYIYADPDDGGRFHFIPWGADAVFGWVPELFGERELPPWVFAYGLIANRLYTHPDGQAAYIARVEELLDAHWDEAAVVAEVDRMEALIVPELPPWERADVSLNIAGKRSWVRLQRETVRAGLFPTPEPWTHGLPASICWPEVGAVSGEFDTLWGTGGGRWPGAGDGTLSLVLAGEPYFVGNIRANARVGTTPDTAGEAIIEIIGLGEDGAWVFAWIVGPLEEVWPDTTLPIDWLAFRGWVGRTTSFERDEFELLGLLSEGSVSFGAASIFPNESIDGSFSATLLNP